MKIVIEDMGVGEEIKISCKYIKLQDINNELLSNSAEDAFNHLQVQVDQRSLGRLLQPEQNEQ